MNVKDAIQARRAYRALGPVDITDETISELAGAARLMCSCYNNQPWRFVFARSKESLARFAKASARGTSGPTARPWSSRLSRAGNMTAS